VVAAAYLRCSGIGQDRGDTWTRQRAAIERFAASHGMAVAADGWFRDLGVSGTREAADRPGLADLMVYVAGGTVRVVLVEDASRLARDLLVSELILAQFARLGVTVIAASSGVDLVDQRGDDPTRRLVRQLLGAVSEFQKTELVARLRAARERIRRAGQRCEGPKPYGLLPGEAAVVERMRALRRKARLGRRRSLAAVARILEEEGAPTRTGKPWTKQAVWVILKRGPVVE
jgi:DNA invertase Pin-like site-specific DNA recombinase